MAAPNALPGNDARLGAWLGLGPASAEEVLAEFEREHPWAAGAARAGAGATAAAAGDEDAAKALLVAARAGHTPVVEALLALGVSPEGCASRLDRTWTPLMHAACGGHAPVVAALLAHGAAPNTPNRTRTTEAS